MEQKQLEEKYFDSGTIKYAQDYRILNKEDDSWMSYDIELYVDEDPEVCKPRKLLHGECKGGCDNTYKDEEFCICWLCDYWNDDGTIRAFVSIHANHINGDSTYTLNDEFCVSWDEINRLLIEAKTVYIDADTIQIKGVRHGDDGDWTLGLSIEDSVTVNRVGYILVAPKPDYKKLPTPTKDNKADFCNYCGRMNPDDPCVCEAGDESGVLIITDEVMKTKISEDTFGDKDDLIVSLLTYLNDAHIKYDVVYNTK